MLRIDIKRILTLTVVWSFLGLFLTVYDFLLSISHFSAGMYRNYTFLDALIFNISAGFFGGIMGGMALTIVNRKLSTKPFYVGLIVVVVFFVFITSVITLFSAVIPTVLSYPDPFTNMEARQFFRGKILTTMHIKNILFWAIVVAISHFSIQVSNKFGPGNLWKIITGKYHLPKHENRVFMFLDLKASTSIAEKLGGEKYHQFLKNIFSDITDPIINSDAEIYQYVGDEVVVSWDLRRVTDKNQYLNCYFEIRSELESKRDTYLAEYGITPEFKAGAHIGEVIAGEVGIIKRDITYSGDVLNTTARIQGQCNDLKASFLVSENLCSYIEPDVRRWKIVSRGNFKLRGKENSIELLSIEKV